MKKHNRFGLMYYKLLIGLITFLLLMIVAAIPTLFFVGLDNAISSFLWSYLKWYILYWSAITMLFFSITLYQKYMAFDRPMKELRKATKRVAKGDFSVRVSQEERLEKWNGLDEFFRDFNKMTEELGSIETLKNHFIADVSHELKTPLAVIQNYSTMLQDEELSEEKRKEYAEVIFQSSKKMTNMIGNILKLNKLENQKILHPSKAYDLSRQLSECVLGFEDPLTRKQLQVEVELEERCIIEADQGLLELVWNNLISNAVKFTDCGGTISLRQWKEGEVVFVTIQDTGCGMDEVTRNHMFDKFYQGDTSHSTEGNGLGLAMVRKVMDLTGGKITVKSQPGEGTQFQVELSRGTED